MNVIVSPPGMTLVADHAHEHDPAANALSGFWLFMMSDLIIFGLMFATYVTMLTPMSFAGGPTPNPRRRTCSNCPPPRWKRLRC
jgi:cytochrome o ubiquinol oxidase subunit 3